MDQMLPPANPSGSLPEAVPAGAASWIGISWRGTLLGLGVISLLFVAFSTGDGSKPGVRKARAATTRRVQRPPQAPATSVVPSPPPAGAIDADTAPATAGFDVEVVSSLDGAAVVQDDGGPIAEILLHYSADSEAELGPVFEDLFRSLPGEIRIQVCCPNQRSVEEFVSRWGPAAMWRGRDVHVVNTNRPISVWSRDRRIARQLSTVSAASFVPTPHPSYDEEKHNDLLLQSLLFSTGLVPRVTVNSFHLEGGNLVSNRRNIFVGGNVITDNENKFPDESALLQELTRTFGRPPIIARGRDGHVPWVHTDMYITPVSGSLVLVASPAEGVSLLGGVGRIELNGPEEEASRRLEFNLTTVDSPLQQRFDDVAEEIERHSYQVVRLPALINVEEDWMVTYNNVLMEQSRGRRAVYMPIYHIPVLDHAAAEVYRQLGFEVHPIDVSAIFQLGGTVRCLTNVTLRHSGDLRTRSRSDRKVGSIQVYEVDPVANDEFPRDRLTRESAPLPRPLNEVLGNETIESPFSRSSRRRLIPDPPPIERDVPGEIERELPF